MNANVSPLDAQPPRPADARARSEEALDRALLMNDLRRGLRALRDGLSEIDPESLSRDSREQLDRASASAESIACMLRLVFCDLSRENDPLFEMDCQQVDVSRLLDYERRRWTAQAREKGLSLRVVAEADAPTHLEVELLPLARMMCNLIENAIRHCDVGGIELVASATGDGGILFRLSDTGPGVPEETLERARRGQGPENVESDIEEYSLGLWVLGGLADRIGARLTLRNRESGGFEALIEIDGDTCFHAEPRKPDPGVDLAGARILLAEDNPTNQMVATQMLRALRAEVTVTSDGSEALAAFEVGEFDLVVLDIEMPRVSGLEVIRRIRARGDARARVPIVALTAYALREHQERIAKAGANGLIPKPISGIDALGHALAAHLPPGFGARPPKPARGGDPVLDAAIYEALSQAIGPELMSELIEKVLADLGAARTDLETGRETWNPALIRSASHILISVAGAIGAVRLQSLARTLNMIAHERGPVVQGVVTCVAEIDAVLAYLAEEREGKE